VAKKDEKRRFERENGLGENDAKKATIELENS
jgi:hypothetical protein